MAQKALDLCLEKDVILKIKFKESIVYNDMYSGSINKVNVFSVAEWDSLKLKNVNISGFYVLSLALPLN